MAVKPLSLYWILFVIISCILVTALRFNRYDYFISQYTGFSNVSDEHEYVSMTQYFRGELQEKSVSAPFSYRPLVSLIASTLPFDALTSINVVNLIALILTIIVIQLTISEYQIRRRDKYIFAVAYIFSFPVFYYSTIGIIEPPAQLMLALGIYMIINQHIKRLYLLLFLSVFVKETSIILIGCFFAYNLTPDKKYKTILQCTGLFITYVGATYLTRKLSLDQSVYVWALSIKRLLFNITRVKTYLSAIITIGIPVVVATYYHQRNSRYYNFTDPRIRLVVMGIFLSVSLFFYGLLSAYADGRPLWYTYIFFMLYFSIMLFEQRKNKNAQDY